MEKWTVVAASFCINMLTFGSLRVSAICPSTTTATRVVLATMAMRSFSGPLAGFFASQFGGKFVTLFGNLAASLALLAFALLGIVPNAVWGVLFGLGMGFGNTLLPAFVNQAFDKHRTKAMCAAHAGDSLGFLVLTPLADAALHAYGLPGTYLLWSALMLHCLPAALFLKRPKRGPKAKVTFYTGDEISGSSTNEDIPPSSLVIPEIEIDGLSRSSSDVSYKDKAKRFSTQTLVSSYFVRMSCSDAFNIDNVLEENSQTSSSSKNDDLVRKYVAMNLKNERCRFASMQCQRPLLTKPSIDIRKYSLKSSASDSGKGFFGRHLNPEDIRFQDQTSISRDDSGDLYDCYPVSEDFARRKSVCAKDWEGEDQTDGDLRAGQNSVKSNVRFFLHPTFVSVAISSAVAIFVWILPVSYRNPNRTQPFILSGAELLGYLAHGFVIDGGYVTMTTYLSVTFFLQGLALVLLPWLQNTIAVVTLLSVARFLGSGIRVLLPVIMGDTMQESRQDVIIPCSLILSGPFLLIVFPFIGSDHDFGRLQYIFTGAGVLCAVCSLIWLLVPKLSSSWKRK